MTSSFVFLSDLYFQTFDDDKLMANKETINGQPHRRPCYLSILEEANGIQWVIPISSRLEKYEAIYERKKKPCDTIVFGRVLGERKAFLLQNMCPVTEKYIENTYIDKNTNQPVMISRALADTLYAKAQKVLRLHRRGIKVIFPDVDLIRDRLLREMD